MADIFAPCVEISLKLIKHGEALDRCTLEKISVRGSYLCTVCGNIFEINKTWRSTWCMYVHQIISFRGRYLCTKCVFCCCWKEHFMYVQKKQSMSVAVFLYPLWKLSLKWSICNQPDWSRCSSNWQSFCIMFYNVHIGAFHLLYALNTAFDGR